jgi:multiple sugar transport system permease protein
MVKKVFVLTMKDHTHNRLWIVGTTVPALVFLTLIAYLPITYAIAISFFKKTAFSPKLTWVGMKNYLYLLGEPDLWLALGRSVVFTVGSVLTQLAWGLGVALLLNRAFKGQTLVRSLFILPYLLPTIVVALVFQWLLNQEYGIINQVLLQAGLVSKPINFIGGLATSMYSVIGVASWQYGSFVALMVLARLQAINPKLYEAARVCGAGSLRCFWDVTLPNLKTTLLLLALLRGIWMFNKFDIIYLVTRGGPLKATETLPIYAYRLAFEEFDFGIAAGVCTFMFLVLVAGSIVYFKLFDPTQEVEVGR